MPPRRNATRLCRYARSSMPAPIACGKYGLCLRLLPFGQYASASALSPAAIRAPIALLPAAIRALAPAIACGNTPALLSCEQSKVLRSQPLQKMRINSTQPPNIPPQKRVFSSYGENESHHAPAARQAHFAPTLSTTPARRAASRQNLCTLSQNYARTLRAWAAVRKPPHGEAYALVTSSVFAYRLEITSKRLE